jgi:hypothetical protein
MGLETSRLGGIFGAVLFAYSASVQFDDIGLLITIIIILQTQISNDQISISSNSVFWTSNSKYNPWALLVLLQGLRKADFFFLFISFPL